MLIRLFKNICIISKTVESNVCLVPENIHTHPKGEGSQEPKFSKESMKQKWNFWRSGRV